jgi:hypothetical protein
MEILPMMLGGDTVSLHSSVRPYGTSNRGELIDTQVISAATSAGGNGICHDWRVDHHARTNAGRAPS